MPGADADIALWDTKLDQAIRHSRLHDDCDYSPFEGHRITAWPVTTISRGEIVWNRGWVSTAYGRGAFLPQEFQPRESHPQEIPA
jgi:dihydropyrimidinase